MFPLNTATVTITLVGHLIFGLVLGLAFLKAPRGRGAASGRGRRLRVGDGQAGRLHRKTIDQSAATCVTVRRPGTPHLGQNCHRQEVCMSSHLEVSKPSGRELVPLTGQRRDPRQGLDQRRVARARRRPSRGCTPSSRTSDSPGRYAIWGVATAPTSTASEITAERVLRSGDEVRVGKSRLIFWEVRDAGDGRLDEETVTAQPAEAPAAADPARIRRARGAVPPAGLRRPVPRARVGPADGRRAVRHRGRRQTASAEPVRQVRHPRRGRPPGPAGQRGAPARRRHDRPACATAGPQRGRRYREVERLDRRDRPSHGWAGRRLRCSRRSSRPRPPPRRAPEC